MNLHTLYILLSIIGILCVTVMFVFRSTIKSLFFNTRIGCLIVDGLFSRDMLVYVIRNQLSKRFSLGYLKSDGKKYTLYYYNGTVKYRVVFPTRRGPSKIESITTRRVSDSDEDGDGDEDDIDITDEVMEALGPSHNFHGIKTDPEFLGYDNITITFVDGRKREFQKNDVITVEPLRASASAFERSSSAIS